MYVNDKFSMKVMVGMGGGEGGNYVVISFTKVTSRGYNKLNALYKITQSLKPIKTYTTSHIDMVI